MEAQAQEMILTEEKQRQKNCMIDIQRALKHYNCRLEPQIIINSGGIHRTVLVLPLSDKIIVPGPNGQANTN